MTDSPAHDYSQRIEDLLDRCLPAADTPPADLARAMRYSVLGAGKRIRPRLVYAAGAALGVAAEQLDAGARAIELIHAYSLIHDDLPAMDNDALRRGRPTTHIAFGPATAILAGDALQALAFETIAADVALAESPGVRAAQIATLARAAGAAGMVGGQALDMAGEGADLDREQLEAIHRRKTGALLRAAALMAADAAESLPVAARDALDAFAADIGLAFQVRDDVLDLEASTAQLGKTRGADIARHKATYPAVLGIKAARDYAERLYARALEALSDFGAAAEPLRAIAAEIVKRTY